MKTLRFLLLLTIICFLNSCKKEEEKVLVNKNSKFIKEWESRKSFIPHKDYLKIKPDHTFELYGGACTVSYNSNGKWEIRNDTLILNSFSSRDCQVLMEFGNTIEKPLQSYIRKTTLKDCNPGESDGIYFNFVNEKFYLKNDTLEYVTTVKYPYNYRIAYFKKQ
ncbi:MAG: hypothetical protein ABIQ27_11875 [Flavobacterium sp.]|uniref:hypothetical protein n=1 Tax=Flavobacterium sp. TaxID=239 RepID=UPI0032678E79